MSMLDALQLTGFLSFAPTSPPLELLPLNVVIGPNGAGKSNLVEAISILRAVPRDLPLPIRQGGGVRDWLWQGEERADRATLELIFKTGEITPRKAVRYRLTFGAEGERFTVLDERIEDSLPDPGHDRPSFYFSYESGRPVLNTSLPAGQRTLRREDIDPTQSILSQRRDPESYPELARISDRLSAMMIYRAWSFGPNAPIRMACRADVRTDVLAEELDNLPARLSALKRSPAIKAQLLSHLRDLSPDFEDIEIIPEGGRLQLYLTERQRNIAAHRLSDGTLRYLALLAVLLDPTPPPLIVIEEPELGLHFDLMSPLAALLQEASARTQLIVTTHSDFLVSALRETPDAILICEKNEEGTTLRRLNPDAEELQSAELGTLWASGHLGGTRW